MEGFVRHFVIPILRKERWQSTLEIGASKGRSTDALLKNPLSSHTIVDPCMDRNLLAKYEDDHRVKVLKCNSLDALAPGGALIDGATFDCILIDGDHNWYTVYHELRFIRERNLLRRGGYIFLHDVGWPYGRRDMYYQPESIPVEFRRPFSEKGVIRGQSELSDKGWLQGLQNNATEEGGPRNGVLTAVEDFLAEHPHDYRFCVVRMQYGLGILQLRSGDLFSGIRFFGLRMKALLYSILGQPALIIRRKRMVMPAE